MQYVTAFSLDYTETDDSDRVLHQLQSDAVVSNCLYIYFDSDVYLYIIVGSCSSPRLSLPATAATAHSCKDPPLPCP
jgi:hypothetical protein